VEEKILYCTEIHDNRNIFTAKEEGKVYTLNNNSKSKIAKIKVDDCIFSDNVKKCDWLFLIEDLKSVFVELKGSDVRTGQKQLLNSYELLEKYVNNDIWFRICIGENNSVPKSIKDDRTYQKLFKISKGNIRIEKRITDTY
jgi:hypothetical protein